MCLFLDPYFDWFYIPIIFLFQPWTFHSQWKVKTSYVRTEWDFFHFQYFQLSFHHPLYTSTWLFVGLSLPLFFFVPFIMIIGWVVHVYYIKFPFRIVPGGPIPILDISGNIILWFIDSPGFNIFKSPNITLFWVPYLSVGAVLGSVTSSYLNFFKDLFFVFIWLRQTIF